MEETTIDVASLCAEAERKIMEMFEAESQASVSVHASVDDGVSRVEVSIASPEGSQLAYTVKTGSANDMEAVAEAAISELKYQGAFALRN